MQPFERTTARLCLSPVSLADANAFVQLETELRRRKNRSAEPPDPQIWKEYLAQFVATWERGDLGYWTLRFRETVAGFGGVKSKRWRDQDCWNLYYRLCPDLQGMGLATEMALAAVEAANEAQPDWPVLAETRPSNRAAIAVAERAGLLRRPDLDDDGGWVVLLLEPQGPRR